MNAQPKPTYHTLLHELIDVMESYDQFVSPPCETYLLAAFRKKFFREFSFKLPSELETFWTQINGFAWKGTTFLGVDEPDTLTLQKDFAQNGILSLNKKIALSKTHFLFLGWSDLDLYVYAPDDQRYLILEKATHLEIRSFDSFEKLLTTQLQELLQPEEDF